MWDFCLREPVHGERPSTDWRTSRRTLVLYESPHRLAETLSDALERFGRRPAVIARELTKLHEEFLRGDLAELLVRAEQKAPRGEITLLIGAASPDIAPSDSLPTSSLPDASSNSCGRK